MTQFLSPMLMVIVDEKEKKIKESLKMVGLRDSVFWLSWFVVYSVFVLIASVLGSVLLHLIVLNNTSSYFLPLLLVMLEFGLTVIMFAFMMTALFSKAKTASVA